MTPYSDQDGISIFLGDCREVLPTLPKVDLVLTDPPYGINFAGQPTKWQRRAGAQPVAWDEEAFSDIALILKAGDDAIVWGGNYYTLPLSRGWLVWVKPDSPPSMGSVEIAWTSYDRNARHIIHSISATNAERVGHPSQKPEPVVRWALLQASNVVKTILDPFMGSGTTLVAAKRLGRKCIGIEIEEKYCEIAVRRLQQGALDLFGA